MLNHYIVWPGFLAGEYPGSPKDHEIEGKLQALVASGVTLFIDLTEPHELKPYHPHLAAFPNTRHERVPIRDINVPDDTHVTRKILNLINQEMESGGTVYVHCWGGVGRTGLIVGTWFVELGLDAEGALDKVQSLYATTPKVARIPRSPETKEQADYVRTWAAIRALEAPK